MDRKLRGLFGLVDDAKFEYRIQADDQEVTQEEYEYCQIITGYLFDEHIGVVKTLGPTWEMVHDPRFREIECCFVCDRKALFGGDARYGKQFVTTSGVFSSSTGDLEQYAEILENGRHFAEVVRKEGYDPKMFFTQPDVTIWQFIKQECPNYFSKEAGLPNKLAKSIFACIKCDLLGLIVDYAEVANIQEWIHIDTGVVVEDITTVEVTEHNPIVWQEVDLLEKALTFRTLLRVTAARILEKMEITKWAEEENWTLTEFERDAVLQMVYQGNYPDNKIAIFTSVVGYIASANKRPYEEREAEQLRNSVERSQEVVTALKNGTRQPITRYTEPEAEVTMDPHAVLVNEILSNPLKKDLFMLYQAAEEDKDPGVADLLAHIFEAPGFVVTEEIFRDFVRKIAAIQKPLESKQFEGTYDIYNKDLLPIGFSDSHSEGCDCLECNPKFGPA